MELDRLSKGQLNNSLSYLSISGPSNNLDQAILFTKDREINVLKHRNDLLKRVDLAQLMQREARHSFCARVARRFDLPR